MKSVSLWKFLLMPFLKYRARILSRRIAPHIEPSHTLLDIGCGNMLISKYLREYTHIDVTGIDVVNMNVTDYPHRLFDGMTIPFKNQMFGVSLLIGVLHHAKRPLVLLRESRRVTARRIIIFEDIFTTRVGRLWLCIRDIIGNLPEELHMNFPCNFHQTSYWERQFRKEKFCVIHKEIFWNPIRWTHHVLYVLEPT